MPGLLPGEMNGYADYGGSRYMANGGGQYSERDEYYRDVHRRGGDPYRDEDPYYGGRREEDIYRRVEKNGGRFNDMPTGGDQNSLADFAQHSNEPVFELDHLATYTAGIRSGVNNIEDGLLRLRKMENTTGIWTMRCILIVDRRYLIVLDKSTGEELEKFNLDCVIEPTGILKNDRREVYNNLVLLTVVDDHRRKNGPGDLHIFQSIKVPSQEIVDEIIAAKEGRGRINQGQRIPPPPVQPAPDPPGRRYDNMYNFNGIRESMEGGRYGGGGASRTQRLNIHESGQSEVLEKDVQLLNHCFDDIERFVARLQQAAEAYKELERRKRERGKQKYSGGGMLSQRARPPPAKDFIDIFQKFKFSFNLLAKLKAHIHDPNAPELVHFLFTPLSLIYEASRDPYHGNRDLADQAVSPVISQEARQLLLHCLTSKEIELLQALGPKWSTGREESGFAPPYTPMFYDGWRPSPSIIDDRINDRPAPQVHERSFLPPEDDRLPYGERNMYQRYEPSPRAPSPRPPTPPRQAPIPVYQDHIEQQTLERAPRPEPKRMGNSRELDNQQYLEVCRRNGVRVYEALHDRQGKNQKEITVKKGDILEVLDDSRKWWKVRNCNGEAGFAPYTILQEIKDDGGFQGGRDRSSGVYNSYLVQEQTVAPPMPPPAPETGRSRQAKRDDDYYYEDKLENTTPPTTMMERPSPRHPSPRQPSPRQPSPRQPSPVIQSAFQPVLPSGRPRLKEKTHQDLVNDELRMRMSVRPGGQPQQVPPVPPLKLAPQGPDVYITMRSSPSEVTEWLEAKGFSDQCVRALWGYSGQDMFQMKKRDFERFIPHEEAIRLEGQITIIKKTAGFETRGGAELKAILQRRKKQADTNESDEAGMGQAPSFRPVTPNFPDSDSDEDSVQDSPNDLADTGKTLREMLIRQRKRIMVNDVFDDPGLDYSQ